MSTRTCKVGVDGRNSPEFHEEDFAVIRDARLEVIKMMSQTKPQHFERIKRENPNIETITRLHGDGFGTGGHPSPQQFANQMIPLMANLKDYCIKYQVHNEPNHVARYEGWGASDEDAANFNAWFLEVYDRLKNAHPWASIGFPGLAVPYFGHRDRDWLRICRPAIQKADWLGVHCYWQTPPDRPTVMMEDWAGLTFKYYHDQYPNKTLEILECGNSNIQNNYPISDDKIAEEYVEWLQEVFKYPYINSAAFFILSSQDTGNWAFFSWRTENNWKKPVIWRVRDMFRPPMGKLSLGPKKPKPKPKQPKQPKQPKPKPAPIVMPEGLTNEMVINAFNRASLSLGLGNWGLMSKAGLSLNKLHKTRREAYSGPGLDQMAKLTDEQRKLVRDLLPEGFDFAAAVYDAVLSQWPDLATAALSLPRSLHIRVGEAENAVERRVARTWNRFGYLLTSISDILGLDLPVAVAVLAAESDQRGIAGNGRLVIRFEVNTFYDRWGRDNAEIFDQHFRMHPNRPSQKHRWRPEPNGKWRDVHASHDNEWDAYTFARSLDETAAYESTSMGFPRIMGFNYDLVGYESAGQMFDAFSSSERYQLLSYFDFIGGVHSDSPRIDALRVSDLETYAALQYGPQNAAQYATTLRNALAAFERMNPEA